MRTNLTRGVTSGSTSNAKRQNASPSRQRPQRPASLLATALLIAAVSAMPLDHRAAAAEAPQPGTCQKADDIMAKMFPTGGVSYDFTGADADKLKPVMDGVTDAVSPQAMLIRIVLIPKLDEAFAFAFDTAGCRTVTLALDFADMAGVFDAAGVHAPFGATFYQLPGLAI
jgi:hypothetical protein